MLGLLKRLLLGKLLSLEMWTVLRMLWESETRGVVGCWTVGVVMLIRVPKRC